MGIVSAFAMAEVRRATLFSGRAGQRLLRLMARPKRHVITHYVDNHGRKHQGQRHPELPITMCTFPVRGFMLTVVIVFAMLAVTVFILTQ
jgi:hypothetical protein